jgi:flagellar protein FliJ
MRWADQLIKLSTFELEVLQVRLTAIVDRRTAAELRLAVLVAQGEAELELARANPESGWRMAAFNEGLKLRKAKARSEIDLAATEEAGARDALAEAFETLKKYEQIAENARVVAARETAKRETAVLDEMGLRRAAGRR